MYDPLLFSEFLLCWIVSNYGCCNDPVHDDPPSDRPQKFRPVVITAWSFVSALLLCSLSGFGRIELLAASAVLAGSLLTRWIRRNVIPTRFLAEFEIAITSCAALLFRELSSFGTAWWTPNFGLQLTRNQCTVLATGAALCIYMIRGGSYIVRGILKRAGGLPDADDVNDDPQRFYAHGRMIGQIERLIVVLIVAAGNLQALAFFFAAKGLIRSKELEERPRADYFLLGSLASFLVALVAGLILQHVISSLWN